MKEVLRSTKQQPRKRMAHIYDLCKVKFICEGGDGDQDQQVKDFHTCNTVNIFMQKLCK